MQYQMQYNICAVILCVIILSTHLMRKKTKEYHNAIFTVITVITLIGAASNIANTLGNMKIVDMNHTLLNFFDYLYFITLSLPPFLLAVYIVSLVKNDIFKISLSTKILLFAPELIALLSIFSNYWTRWFFYYKDGVYQRGIHQMILYAIDLYYIVFGIAYIFREREETSKSTRFCVCAFMGVGYGAALIQFLNPQLLLMHFGIALCDLGLLLNLQKSEEYLNSELGIFNRSILEKIMKRNFASGKKMRVVVIRIEDLNFIVHNFGSENRKNLLQQIAKFLEDVSRGNVYYYNSGTFAIMVSSEQNRHIAKWGQLIQERFDRQWTIENANLLVNYKMMYCSLPEDISDFSTFYFLINEFSGAVPDKEHLVDVRDIDLNKIDRKIRVEKIIKRAIEEDNFRVYFQPIYSIEKNKITSAEALLRLVDPDEGFIPPDEFIPIAEKNGMIIRIGEMVFEKVFRFMKEQNLRKRGIEYIEINLSTVQCMQRELADSLLAILAKYNIDTTMVNLEITETAAIDSPKVLLRNMEKLSGEGITFSMDDFGTGYSNIGMLMTLPMHIIKLDKSLIDMATANQKGKEVLSGTAAMVKNTGYKIVAEGIEEKEQLEMLKEYGVDYIQGYYFSRPLPEDEFVAYIDTFDLENK